MKKKHMPMPLVRSAVLAARPQHIPKTTWAQFCDYKMREDVMKIADQNRASRAKYDSPHTGGLMKLLVRGLEITEKTGQPPTRGELYVETHTRKDGSYTDVQVAFENMPGVPRHVDRNDSLGRVKGAEHSGRVRGVGFGVTPSQVFKGRKGRTSGDGESSAAHVLGHCLVAKGLRTRVDASQERLAAAEAEIRQLRATLASRGKQPSYDDEDQGTDEEEEAPEYEENDDEDDGFGGNDDDGFGGNDDDGSGGNDDDYFVDYQCM
ncbi:hypothetical protein LINGRAHAP2_LOCUS30575 [Linum grandiflorum]